MPTLQNINPVAEINPGLAAGAEIDETGQYRYHLWRTWSLAPLTKHRITWIMLNPSTADGFKNDATLRQIIALSKIWGFIGLDVFNMFALRSTDPRGLLTHHDPVGPLNDQRLRIASTSDVVVLAWGAWGSKFPQRVNAIHDLLSSGYTSKYSQVMCLGFTKSGQPVHPLRLPHNTPLVPY